MTTFYANNWSEFRIEKRDKYPKGKHFIALVFGTRTEYSGYSDRSGGSDSYSVPNVDVYAFTKRNELDLFVGEIARTSTPFVFFEVTGIGKATVKVDIETEIGE